MKPTIRREMSKKNSVENEDSEHSIDLSKPEGINSFWNLFSKNNKKEEEKNEFQKIQFSPKMKLNSIALKILKMKGIDLTNMNNNMENIDLQSLTKNHRVFVINPKQMNLTKKDALGNKLMEVLNSQKTPREEIDLKLNVTSLCDDRIQSKTNIRTSSITYMKNKKLTTCALTSKKGVQSVEKPDKPVIFSKNLSEIDLIKFMQEVKSNKKQKKRVIIPLYVSKKKAGKPKCSLEGEPISKVNEQDEKELDALSLISKIKAIEHQINDLQMKSKDAKSYPFEKGITNKVETINYILPETQPAKRNNENNPEKKTPAVNCQSKILPEDPLQNDPKKNDKTSLKTENFVDISDNSSEILIRNHNLVIPEDLSKENLFRANPSAGCDTILKLFNALSQKGYVSNQANDHSRENVEKNHPISRLIWDKKIGNNDDKIMSFYDYDTNIKTECKHNSNTANVTEDFPRSCSSNNFKQTSNETDSNESRNIFTLPVDLSNLNSTTHNQSDAENINKNNEKELFKQDIQDNVHSESIGLENNSKLISDETFKNNKLDRCKSCGNVGLVNIKKTSSHKLYKSSSEPVKAKASGCYSDISVDSINGTKTCSTKTISLNITQEQCKIPESPNHPPKLLKKTTISCPVQSPEEKVSITILIENNLRDENNTPKNVISKVLVPSGIEHTYIEDTTPSLYGQNKHAILNKENNIAEKNAYFTAEPSLNKDKFGLCNMISSRNFDPDQAIFNRKPREETVYFGLASNVPYLRKDQRKDFRKVSVKGDWNERSFSSVLKVNQHNKNSLENVKCESGLINIFSQSRFNMLENNTSSHCKFNPQNNGNILMRFGIHNARNQFDMESSGAKQQSKIVMNQQDTSFGYNKETNMIHCGYGYSHNSESQNQEINSPFKNYFECERNRDNIYFSKQSTTNLFDPKKTPCRFSSTLNQESLARHLETCSPFLKIDEEIGLHKKDLLTIDQRFYKTLTNDEFKIEDDKTQGLRLLNDSHETFSQINGLVHKTVMCMQSNCNLIEKPKVGSPLYNEKLDIPPIIGKGETENRNPIGKESEIRCLEPKLENTKFKNVNNGVQKSSYLENESIQQNDYQKKPVCNSGLLNSFKRIEEFETTKYDGHKSQSDSKVMCQKTVKNFFSKNKLNMPNNNTVQNVNVKTEYICITNRLPCCCCCCTAVLHDDWKDDPDE